MENMIKKASLLVIALLVCAGCGRHACAQEQGSIENNSLVGRIAHIEGQLLRYVPDEDDWVLTDVDTPFGEYDNLFSSEDAKVEIIMPNNTVARIGGDTQVQLIELTNESTEIDVSSGTARLYNKSSSVKILATTPFGDVIMPPGTVCDMYVHEDQAEVVSLKGVVEFIKTGSTTPHDVIAGSSSIIANSAQIVASNHRAPAAWDAWNVDRDAQWARRMQARGESQKYLPRSLQHHAYELEENGNWERVHYDGAYRYFWRPAYVNVGWTPFSTGRWIVWHGERTWVPCEPFGYVTHHYGNWVRARGCWYWAPPVSSFMISAGSPQLHIGMHWYPGRVSWVSSSISVGWFPLAPFEIYYSSRYWGPRCKVRHYHHYYDHRKYRHHKHARYMKHKRFHHAKNYRRAGFHKRHYGERFRGSGHFPEKLRKNYKGKGKHRYASTMPQYRDRVKKIDERRISRLRQSSYSRKSTNPFKRKDEKRFENKRGTGKTKYKNISRKTANTNQQTRLRSTTGNKRNPSIRRQNEAIRKYAKAHTPNRGKAKVRVKKPEKQAFKKTTAGRGKYKTPVPRKRQNARLQANSKKQYASNRNRYTKKTVTVKNVSPSRTQKTARVSRSYAASRLGSSYARSGNPGMHRSSAGRTRQSGTGRAHASHGRRW